LDINEADSAAWESLYGIGPYLAKRITLFRESLGGFISIEQVKETYGLRDSVFQSIRPCLVLKTVIYPSLSINHSTLETLGKHPYIRYKLARNICLYRENNGFFANVEQLKAIPAINDSIFMKIKPYLTIEAVGE
jgi:competence ComEA-like helix-hairpin-helix protein